MVCTYDLTYPYLSDVHFNHKTENLILFALAAAQFTHIIDFMIMMPLGDILQKTLQISPFQFSALVAAYPIAAFVSSLTGVVLLDRFDRRAALLLAYSGFVLGTLSSAFLPNTDLPSLNYAIFVLTRVITGLAGGFLSALVMSIVSDVFPLERRGRAMGVVGSAFALAAVLGVPLGLQLVNWYDNNWHAPFLMVGLLGLLVLVAIYFFLPSLRLHITVDNTREKPAELIRNVVSLPNQRMALLFTILLVLGQFTVIPFLTPYMISNVGLNQSEIPYIYLVGGICTALTSPLTGRLVDAWGRKKTFYLAAAGSMLPILLLTSLGKTDLGIVLCFTGSFFILISGRMIPANTILTAVVRPENRGGFLSLNTAVMSLSSGVSAMLAGSIIIQDYEGAPLQNYNFVGVLACVATLIAIYIVRRLKEFDS